MPFAGVSTATEHFDLKTVEGGFVELRRMTYGEKLTRQDMVKLSLEMGKGKDIKGEMAMANKMVTHSDFMNCIIAHNLEKDENGTPFNFRDYNDFIRLDPRVGEEIDKLINSMNNFEESDEGKE